MRPAWHVVAMPPPAARCMLLDAPRGTAPPPPVNLHGEACGSMPRPLHAPRFPPPPALPLCFPCTIMGGMRSPCSARCMHAQLMTPNGPAPHPPVNHGP